MAASTNKILRSGNAQYHEGIVKTAKTVKPGHLVIGYPAAVEVHATAGGNASKTFVIERSLIGKDTTESITAGEQVFMITAEQGAVLYARVAAGASAIALTDLLESAGDGTLRKHTTPSQAVDEGGSATYTIAQYPERLVAKPLEAVDNSGGSSEVFIKVEVL